MISPLSDIRWSDEPIANHLMVTLSLVIFHEFPTSMTQRCLIQGDDPVETLLFNRANKSLVKGIRIRRARRQPDRFNAFPLK